MYRSRFNLGHYHLLTGDMGSLIPVGCQFVSMGDTLNHHITSLIRMSPPAAPLMHKYKVRFHHWFVPYRIIWEDYEVFMTKGETGMETPAFPQINVASEEIGSLADYLGIPVHKIPGDKFMVNALPFRAYAKIYNEFYRDQDLQEPLPISILSGEDNITSRVLQRVAWSKDYLTTARPFTQRGPEVTIPVFSKADGVSEYKHFNVSIVGGKISGTGSTTGGWPAPATGGLYGYTITLTVAGATLMSNAPLNTTVTLTNGTHFTINRMAARGYVPDRWIELSSFVVENNTLDFVNSVVNIEQGVNESVRVTSGSGFIATNTGTSVVPGAGDNRICTIDFSKNNGLAGGSYHSVSQSSTGVITIQDTRLAEAIQKMQERRAKYGARFLDYQASYGIKGSDSRLQLPEYLAGGKSDLKISEVLQTSPYEDSGVGDLYGYGIAGTRTRRYKKFFEEHGVVLTLMSVLPANVYAEHMHRDWFKTSQEEYFQYELQGIGQQEIYKGEVFPVSDAAKKEVFGYQGRYDEMRHTLSSIHGEFRTLYNYWHSAREFNEMPVLNGSFVSCNPSKRIFLEQTKHSMLVMTYHHIRALRLCSKKAFTSI